MTIDRTQFLPPQVFNGDFPVQLSDTLSVPSERMAYLLAGLLETDGSVLEIGTGSGYQTAVLAEKCRDVTSIEASPQPGISQKLPNNVALIVGDGFVFETGEEFDGVLVTFATEWIPDTWGTQLKDGARLVVPVKIGNYCRISVYQRRGDTLALDRVIAYAAFTDAVQTLQ
jgi:protein-L-isoaspartate(D-aspartate) O-methyltransferase